MTEVCKNTKITRKYRASKEANGFVLVQIQRHVPAEMAEEIKVELRKFLVKLLTKKIK